MPEFSLIIPVYNVKPYIRKCLDSILNQDCGDWEALLINDGSSDGSGEICDEYAAMDSRFRVFHKENGGVSSARNVGLDNAKGEWIWFVDGDDYIVPSALETLQRISESNKCDTIFFGLRHDWNGVISEEREEREDIIGLKKDEFLNQVQCYANPTMLFSRNLIGDQVRFTSGIKMAEDLEFQYKYLLFSRQPIQIKDCLYVYQHRQGSATTNISTFNRNAFDCLKVADNLAEFLQLNKFSGKPWISIRIRNLIKSSLVSSTKLNRRDLKSYKSQLKQVVNEYQNIGYKSIADKTIRLAIFSHKLYSLLLKIYLKQKK